MSQNPREHQLACKQSSLSMIYVIKLKTSTLRSAELLQRWKGRKSLDLLLPIEISTLPFTLNLPLSRRIRRFLVAIQSPNFLFQLP